MLLNPWPLNTDYYIRIIWRACKRTQTPGPRMLVLTNPTISGVGAKGLYVSQELQMLTHYSLKSTTQTFSQVCSFNPIPESWKQWDMTVQWPKALARTKAWLESWLYHLLSRVWSVVKSRWDNVCQGLGRMLGLKYLIKMTAISTVALQPYPSTNYPFSLPTCLKLAFQYSLLLLTQPYY